MDIEKGIRFECQGSGNCCVSRGTYGFVYLSKKDIKKLSDGFKITEQNFVKNYCQKTDGFIHLKELKKNNGNCIFLKDNKCTVYKSRDKVWSTSRWYCYANHIFKTASIILEKPVCRSWGLMFLSVYSK